MNLLLSQKSVTLMEILIAIVILGILALAFSSLDLFSRYNVLTTDIRAQLQNEASSVIEHMAKHISQGVGSEVNPPDSRAVDLTAISGNTAIRVWIDSNQDGVRDNRIAYRYTAATGGPATRYQIWFYANCVGNNCNQAGSTNPEVIARRISFFNRTVADNTVFVEVQDCFDPDGNPHACGTHDNPRVEMRTSVKMPAVSVH